MSASPADPGLDVAGLSHVGLRRKDNEDHFFVARSERSFRVLQTNLPEGDVLPAPPESVWSFAVADGVGGSAKGEVASRMALTTLVDLVLNTPDWIFRIDDARLEEELRRRAGKRTAEIHAKLKEEARRDPSLEGFGSTLSVGLVLRDELVVAHVGDSPAYLFRKGRIHRLTRDHTVAADLAEAGAIPPERIERHPFRSILSRLVGGESQQARPDVLKAALQDGDVILLCTDGLNGMVPDEKIAAVLGAGKAAAATAADLVDLALKAGGRDNVTVVVARVRLPSA